MNNNSMKIIRLITFTLVFLHINTEYAKNMNIYNFSFEDIDGNLVNLDKLLKVSQYSWLILHQDVVLLLSI